MGILTFVEHDDGTPADACLEALTVARDVAEEAGSGLQAAIVGDPADELVETLGEYGVDRIAAMADAQLDPYAPEAWAVGLDHVIEEMTPEALIGAGIERTQELFARVGARRNQPFAANCNDITPGEPYTVIKQRWGGSLLSEATVDGDPTLLSVTPHEHAAQPSDAATNPAVDRVNLDLSDVDTRVRIDRIEEADIEGIPLGEARVVVGGGRGVGSAADFDQLEELADLLGGTVGASRAAVNEGWRPHDDQIGLTGAKISPDIYIACGISGAVQHWVGAKGAEHVLAINTDPEAAIIQKSDWAVIGDLHDVIPAIIDELENR